MSRTCSWCPTPSWSAASSRPSASACRPAGPSRRGSLQPRPDWPDIEVNANTFKPECSQLKRINLFLILPPCFSRSVIFWKAKLPSGRFLAICFENLTTVFLPLYQKLDRTLIYFILVKILQLSFRLFLMKWEPRRKHLSSKSWKEAFFVVSNGLCRNHFVSNESFKKTMLKLFFRLFFAQPESKLVLSAYSWSSWTPLSNKKPELNQNQTFLSPIGHSFESNDI